MLVKAPKGTADYFGSKMQSWQKIEEMIRRLCKSYHYGEIRTPIFEFTDLFKRSVGEETDVVQKEMYTFLDKKGRSITLRPENTASAARAYLENNLYAGTRPSKLYYMGPMFRYENPQAGRMRQFHQFGLEVFGSYSPIADAEVISLAHTLLQKVGLKNVELQINSLGCKNCRALFNKALVAFLEKNRDQLCETCKQRIATNPLRVLDCKNEHCQSVLKDAPDILGLLDDECREHFEKVQDILKQLGIAYTINSRIVRGLDYYNRTVFEFVSKEIGAQGTICGGGRYDGLMEELGGPPTGGVGLAVGLERLILLMENQSAGSGGESDLQLYIGCIGEKGSAAAQTLACQLRQKDISVETDLIGRSVKAQLKYADKIGAKFTCILGDSEIDAKKAAVKNMVTGEQFDINIEHFAAEIQTHLTE